MTRPDVLPIKRKALSKLEFAKLAVQQNGKCAVCQAKLRFEPHQVRDEHIVSLFGGGSNELSNRELRCPDCVTQKNADDAARHAKIKRLRGETKTGPKKKIQSRGFDKTYSRKMNGQTVRRGNQ